jgi:hypothetical protein
VPEAVMRSVRTSVPGKSQLQSGAAPAPADPD